MFSGALGRNRTADPGRGTGVHVLGSSSDIYVMDADGTHLAHLTQSSEAAVSRDEPAWPEGTKIAYRSNEGGISTWIMNDRGSVEQARDELDETGRIQPDTALALGLFALGAMMLWPDVQKAWRQLGRE